MALNKRVCQQILVISKSRNSQRIKDRRPKYRTPTWLADFKVCIINNVDKKTFKWNETFIQMYLRISQAK